LILGLRLPAFIAFEARSLKEKQKIFAKEKTE